jgi:hypothetical protein
MKEIKTAEEFLRGKPFSIESIHNNMIEFARKHVIAALESASKEGKIIDEDGDTYHQPHIFHCNGEEYKNWIDKNSILNAYPLNLIK